jgi:chorismate lyase
MQQSINNIRSLILDIQQKNLPEDFVQPYVSSLPNCLDAVYRLSLAARIYEDIKPLLTIAIDYFLSPSELPAEHPQIKSLLDKAYFAHRLLEEINDRFVAQSNLRLMPKDVTMANVIAHELIGEPLANQLDQAVLVSVELFFNNYQFSQQQKKSYLCVVPHPSIAWKEIPFFPRYVRPTHELLDWLTDEGSLTARLVAKSNGDFRVVIHSQRLGIPQLNEAKVLGITPNRIALIREVILYGCDQPWVFARSVLPLSSLTGPLRHLRKQNNKPLGAYLFNQPSLARKAIEIATIKPTHNYVPNFLFSNNSTKKEFLWGRRSVFYLEQRPLLVSEVFLPSF